MLSFKKSIIGTAVITLVATASPLLADDVKRDGYKILRYSNKELSERGRKAFRGEFRDYGFYSAFAVSTAPGETMFGWSSGKSDQNFVRKNAIAWCENSLKRHGGKGPCKLYAEIVPSGKRPAYKFGKYTLSQKASAGYKDFQEYSEKPYKAFAFATNGAWAWRSSNTSFSDAKTKALNACSANALDPGETASQYTKCHLAN